jgi:hypothetical protein
VGSSVHPPALGGQFAGKRYEPLPGRRLTPIVDEATQTGSGKGGAR